MILLDDLMAFLDVTMGDAQAAAKVDVHMPNGLQVRGRDEVRTIAAGVSASLRLFEEAVALGADALVVHHGMNMPSSILFDPIFCQRLRYLWDHGLSLIGYHYLLDSHPEIGHNAQIIKALGGRPAEPYPPDGWGWVGEIEGGGERDALLAHCSGLFSQTGVHYPFGPEQVRRMVVVSGAGAPYPGEMDWLIKQHIDLFITGEPREWNRELFREAGISFVAGGHYYTERIGVQALGDLLQRQLDVTVKFIDVANTV